MAHRPGRKVLLIVADQWRGDTLESLGHPCVATPNLSRLAARGTTFARHFVQGTPCGPSRASLATGQYLMNHRVATNWTPTSAGLPSLPRLLRAAGVAPCLIGYTTTIPDPRVTPHDDPRFRHWSIAEGWEVLRPFEAGREAYLRWLEGRGHPRLESYEAHFATLRGELARGPFAAEEHDSRWLAEAAVEFLRRPPEGDWLLHLGFFRPHPPLAAPEAYLAPYRGIEPPAPTACDPAGTHPYLEALRRGTRATVAHPALEGLAAELSPAEVAELRRAYYALCSEVDAEVGRVLAVLEESGQLDETLVLFTSDHGEQLGDQGLVGKRGLTGASFHVPLVVAAPGATGAGGGRVVERFTEAVDLLPTILDWLGAEIPPSCDGRSLLPFLAGETPEDWRGFAVYEQDFRDVLGTEVPLPLGREEACFMALRDERWAFVHFAGLPPALFDLAEDPGETRNLADDPAHAGVVADCTRRLLTHRLRHADRTLTSWRVTPAGLVRDGRDSAPELATPA
ncbi:Arylsulfatase A [Tistlia consotensis]|uniref:Arylsulfatase A n=1 Tax=Tistlia consotensis USBA 355 TaxID=560819 RepID=A0A1Y6B2S3_9PROT|nr:sulfatase-like hydrolase/transferase [Tistlia consotensis]SME88489.1 Arylsulfatase A [Tistlia consotensis USBA 355]SNR24955.1 Arylsulfatase A [Tistlia consotensis]